MDEKRAVISGGTSGIGNETVKVFLENGYKVVFTGVEEDSIGNKIAEELREKYNQEAYYFRTFIDDEESVKALVKYTIEKISGCDALINNAGIFEGGEAHLTPVESWDRVMSVDVKGVFLMSKHFVPQMIEQGKGAIVNTASISGIAGEFNMVAYAAAKGAVINLTKAMACDYGTRGIRVNSVSPGATQTPMFLNGSSEELVASMKKAYPLGRLGEPKDIANAIFFLASDKAAFITGVNLPVDGGVTSHTGQPKQDKENN